MADLPSYPDSNDDAHAGPDRRATTSTSRWVYVFLGLGIALVVLVVVLHLTGTIGRGSH